MTVEENDRLAFDLRFRDADVLLDDRCKHFLAESLAYFLGNHPVKPGALLVHRDQDAKELDFESEVFGQPDDHLVKRVHPSESVELRLGRNQEMGAGDDGHFCQASERRGAVDQDPVEALGGGQRLQGMLHPVGGTDEGG